MTSSADRRRRFVPPRRKQVLMALAYNEHRMNLGVAQFARQAHWIVDNTMTHYGTLPDYWRGDGILTLVIPDRPDLIEFLQKAKVPTVALTGDGDGIATACVCLDNQRIGRIAAEHLLERGFKNLAFLKCSDYADIRGRERGFVAAVQEAGLPCHSLNWLEASRKKPRWEFHAWLKRRLSELPQPLGVLAQSARRAYSLTVACQLAGISVPEQIAVVGVDNDEYTCEFGPVTITTVDTNRQELAYQGAQLLDRLMQGEKPPSEPILVPPGGVILRQSSDILAVEHTEVAKALSFVWRYYNQRIGVDDVVAATSMSRCGLYRSFEKFVGRTIRQELERTRIEHSRRLLLTTNDKVSRIARLCGFGSGEQFCRVFTAFNGTTPSDFRRKHGRATSF